MTVITVIIILLLLVIVFGIVKFRQMELSSIEFHNQLDTGIEENNKLITRLASIGNGHISQNNICENCEAKPENSDLYETGVCGKCGAFRDCTDPELLGLYRGLGVSDDFIHSHLPRLREYKHRTLSLADIGEEIQRHIKIGVCHIHPCQGYGNEVRKKMRFEQ